MGDRGGDRVPGRDRGAASIRATYRVQLHAGFTFGDLAAIAPYLRDLGVSHVYLSPVLQAAPGSTHGYDVVDPTAIDEERGGRAGFDAMVGALEDAGVRLVIDIVPNHLAIGDRSNPAWWDVMRNGRDSAFAPWFDIDWEGGRDPGRVLAPLLGDHLGRMIDAGEVTISADDGGVVRAAGVEMPLRPGTWDEASGADAGPDTVQEVLDRQHYRLAWWRTVDDLDHRRFFDITSLAGVRVEDDAVFDATHDLIAELVRTCPVDEVRVDHVDGLRRPQQYLDRLAATVAPARVVVEKILQAGEELPESWPVAGTTGYDFVTRVNHLWVDERNEGRIAELDARFTGDERTVDDVEHVSRRVATDTVLVAEVDRLTRLAVAVCRSLRRHRDHTWRQVREAIGELLAAMPVYRTYAHPGAPASAADESVMERAVSAARARRPGIDAELLKLIAAAALGRLEDGGELGERFQQVSSAVMAKGVEDTAFYRDHRLISLNEVGGDPGRVGDPVEDFHRHNARIAERWPRTMTTLSTHDTKRSADVRARIAVLSEMPDAWEAAMRRWDEMATAACGRRPVDPGTRSLLFQTLVGVWPIDDARLRQAMLKAVREAKDHTSWTDADDAYESGVARCVDAALSDARAVAALEEFLAEARIVERGAVNSLAQTALLLTAPGVPDLYQGTEMIDLSLVDPDNRRPVDYASLRARLAEVGSWSAADAARHLTDGGAKLWLTHRLLAVRARCLAEDDGAYTPLHPEGARANHVVAYRHGDVVTVVPRLTPAWPWDGWDGLALTLDGRWRDALTGAEVCGRVPVAELFAGLPAAVLVAERP